MDKTTEALPPAINLAPTDTIHLVQAGGSREVTLAELAQWVKTAESIVPASLPYRGARVHRTSDLIGITWPNIVTWQAAEFDTEGFWNVMDPTKFIVPPGVSKVRLSASVTLEGVNAAGGLFVAFRRNATGTDSLSAYGLATIALRMDGVGYASNIFNIKSAVIDVVAGDYFDVRVNTSMSGVDQILATTDTWFDIEVVETI